MHDPLDEPLLHRPSFADRLHAARGGAPAALWSPASTPPPLRKGGRARRGGAPPERGARAVATARLRGAAVLTAGVGGGIAALAGWGLLAALLLTRTLAPATACVSRDLWVDYTATPAVAAASFLPDGAEAPRAARPGAAPRRAFGAGRRVDVWLTLAAADAATPADVIQVRAELVAGDGRVLAAASRPALLPHRSRAARALRAALLAPLVVAGLADDLQSLRLPLFNGYRDAADAPAVGLRVALAARPTRAGGADPPPLHSLRAHARQRLGWAVGALYLVRPGDTVAVPLYALAAACVLAGTTAALVAGVIAHVDARRERGGGADEAPTPSPFAPSSASELSPSSASASVASDDDGGGGLGVAHAGGPGELPASAESADEWSPAAGRDLPPAAAPLSPPTSPVAPLPGDWWEPGAAARGEALRQRRPGGGE
jgi:hypothetical protein